MLLGVLVGDVELELELGLELLGLLPRRCGARVGCCVGNGIGGTCSWRTC